MSLPSVSIAIPTIRRPDLTKRAIDSVLHQDYPGVVECCVYVDGRDGETRAMLARFDAALRFRTDLAGRRPLVWGAADENRGIAAAKNAALRLGHGQLRGVLDSDDVYDPRFVSRCVAELQACPDVVAVYTDNRRQRSSGATVVEPAAEWSAETLPSCQVRGDCYLARWPALEACGLHDERFELEVDYDLFYALAQVGPLRRIPEPLMTVTAHAGQTTVDRSRAAFWHAACLAKYGQTKDWAVRRAAGHPEWLSAVEDGYRHGLTLRADAGR